MMGSIEAISGDEVTHNGLNIIQQTPFRLSSKQLSPPWFDLRVFYVRISSYVVTDSTPQSLTVNHIPLDPEALLEVNGTRCGINSDGITSLLRRDRVDKKSEEVTFVSTDSIRFTGSVKFDIFNGKNLVLSGALEMSDNNGATTEPRNSGRNWSLKCEAEPLDNTAFLKGQRAGGFKPAVPTLELYVAGCFRTTPIILTKSMKLSNQKKHNYYGKLDTIPEYEAGEVPGDSQGQSQFQVSEYGNYKLENEVELNHRYWGGREYGYLEGDGELSWFNAGVRVGVGISLGICLGVGVGVGLLAKTYQRTARSITKWLF